MTHGSSTINGYDVYSQLSSARKYIGYCPQYDGLIRMSISIELRYLSCNPLLQL